MNMPRFPWLPVGFCVAEDASVRRLLSCGPRKEKPEYQIVEAQNRDRICILLDLAHESPAVSVAQSLTDGRFCRVEFGGEKILAAAYTLDDEPMRVGDIPARADFLTTQQLFTLVHALAKLKSASWMESVFLPAANLCLPFGKKESAHERKILAVRLLTGGVADSSLSAQQIHAINRWIAPREVAEFFRVLDLPAPGKVSLREHSVRSPQEFVLPGHPIVEQAFRDSVIDYYHRRDEYEEMGINPTNGILLHGPTGSGKTYAVRKLADFLDWPIIEVSISGTGSPYIHKTSINIKRKFDEARRKAPAIVFLDELDSLGMERDHAGAQSYKMEEVTELLRQVETAGKEHVLVIAATNLPEKLDQALKRKGRFDLLIEVPYPGVDGVLAVLEHCLSARPHAAGMALDQVAKDLAKQSLASVEWAVNEAGRIAVKNGKKQVDEESLREAVHRCAIRTTRRRPSIGFTGCGSAHE